MKNLNKLFNEVLSDIESLDIPVRTVSELVSNKKYVRTWGHCERLRTVGGKVCFKISIAESLLDDSLDDMAAKTTIAHELLHTIDGCMNHGPKWNKYARLLDVFGYNVKRITSCAEKGIDPNQHYSYKYLVTCESCGHTCRYLKKSNIVAKILVGDTSTLRCGVCRSHRLIAETL